MGIHNPSICSLISTLSYHPANVSINWTRSLEWTCKEWSRIENRCKILKWQVVVGNALSRLPSVTHPAFYKITQFRTTPSSMLSSPPYREDPVQPPDTRCPHIGPCLTLYHSSRNQECTRPDQHTKLAPWQH